MKNSRSQYILYKNCDGKYDAGNKFTNDVIEICKRQKFQAIGYGCNGSNNFVNRIACFTKYIFDLLKIYNSSIIYILYPTMPKYFKCLCYIKRVKKCKLVGIVMDLPFLFIENADSADERNQLLKMDAIIVQNEKQRALLRNIGIWDKSTEEIEILDFLGTPKINSMSVWGGQAEICYGGTLAYAASSFIYKWQHNCNLTSIKVNVYGRHLEEELENPHFEYKGVLPPDEIVENLEGDFGLVWSGSEIDCCGGMKGVYYEYASPHKLSMYLMAGMPVIVSQKSALADVILSKNIGITVKSLNEIQNKLSAISKLEYAKMKKSVIEEAKLISQGGNLERCLKEIYEALI